MFVFYCYLFQTTKECFEFNTIMIKPKSKHTIRHILELPSSLPPSKRPAAKPPDAPWTKRRKLILPPVNKQVYGKSYAEMRCMYTKHVFTENQIF